MHPLWILGLLIVAAMCCLMPIGRARRARRNATPPAKDVAMRRATVALSLTGAALVFPLVAIGTYASVWVLLTR